MSITNIQPKVYKKKLQFQERRYYRAPNSTIFLIVRIKGDVSESLLKNAVLKAQERHVLLRVRVMLDNNFDAWFTTENVKDIPIEIVKRTGDDQWIQISLREFSIPLDYSNRPPIKFILVYSKNISELIIKSNHICTDGLGMAYLARDILEFLGNPNKKVEILPPPPIINRDSIPSTISDNFFVTKTVQWFNKKWEKQKVFFDEEDYINLNDAYWQRYTNRSFFIELSETETSKLVSRCRQEGVTVNTLLIAAFIRAQSIAKGFVKKQNGGFAVNLRDRLVDPIDQFYGFFATGLFPTFKDSPNRSFWSLARDTHRRIRKKMDRKVYYHNLLRFFSIQPTMTDALIMKMYGKIIPEGYSRYEKLSSYSRKKDIIRFIVNRFMSKTFSFGVTNLGRLDFPRNYGDFELDRIFLSVHTALNTEVIIGGATASGKLSLVISYIENTIDDEVMYKIKENMLDILNKEIGFK